MLPDSSSKATQDNLPTPGDTASSPAGAGIGAPSSEQGGARRPGISPVWGRLLLVVAAAGLLSLILAGAYYQADIETFLRLQAWDRRAPEGMVREFVRIARTGDTDRITALVDPGLVKIEKAGKLTGFQVVKPGDLGPSPVSLEEMVPTGTLTQLASRVKLKEGVVEVQVQYEGGRWGVFKLNRVAGRWRIVDLPGELTEARPQPEAWE